MTADDWREIEDDERGFEATTGDFFVRFNALWVEGRRARKVVWDERRPLREAAAVAEAEARRVRAEADASKQKEARAERDALMAESVAAAAASTSIASREEAPYRACVLLL